MVFGKLIGGLLGWWVAGPIGLIVAGLVGHAFDRGLGRAMAFATPENLARVKQSFFRTTFLLSGYLAKADGRISQAEVDHTEQLIAQLGLSPEQREEAIGLFREGAESDFDLERVVGDYLDTCGQQPQLRQTLLMFLISLAFADQKLEPQEHAALLRIGSLLGLGAGQMEQLLQMARAQDQFQGQHYSQAGAPASNTLEDAYTALGVTSSVSDSELKRAYRKLMSENHPDKLIAKGVPESMIRLATERSQEISTAYDLLKKHRGMK